MTKNNSTVAIYPTHEAAEAAIKELQLAGFDLKKLSIVGRDYHTDVLNRTNPETLMHHQ